MVLVIDQGRAISAISLGLRGINLEAGRMRRGGETDGGGEVQSRQALSMAFVALQVVGPRRLYRRCHWCLWNSGYR
jgi:hypothetical protein